jgi:D-tyrosyl-tRNA(Tyr) deacylase
MIVVFQRVVRASVEIEGITVGAVDAGGVVLVGVKPGDDDRAIEFLADKVINLRVFGDNDGKMNRSTLDIGGSLLVISQFTLYGDCRKGRRPSFVGAAEPGVAESIYDRFVETLREKFENFERTPVAETAATPMKGVRGRDRVQTGRFGADMKVSLVNDGPVTIIIESP